MLDHKSLLGMRRGLRNGERVICIWFTVLLCLDLIYDSEERVTSKEGINDHDKNESKRSAHTFHQWWCVRLLCSYLSALSSLFFSLFLSISLFIFQHGPYCHHSWPLASYLGESVKIYFCSAEAV